MAEYDKKFFRGVKNPDSVLYCEEDHEGNYYVINGAWTLYVKNGKYSHDHGDIDVEEMPIDHTLNKFGDYNQAIEWALEEVKKNEKTI